MRLITFIVNISILKVNKKNAFFISSLLSPPNYMILQLNPLAGRIKIYEHTGIIPEGKSSVLNIKSLLCYIPIASSRSNNRS